MKPKVFLMALCVAAGIPFLAEAVTSAPAPVSCQADDLFLGVHASGGIGATYDYLVDIGSASLYTGASGTVTPNLGAIGADLTFLFGANWHNRPDVLWSISGTPGFSAVGSDPGKLLYGTKAESPAGTRATAWNGGSSSTQGGIATKMTSMAAQYAYNPTLNQPCLSTSNSLVGTIQNTSNVNSYATYMPGGSNAGTGTAFGFFNPTIEGDFTNGTAGSVLDLFRVPVGYNIAGGFVGSFQLDDNGNLTFTPNAAAAVPPTVTSGSATATYQGATVNGTLNPNGTATSAFFEYGLSTAYGMTTGTQQIVAGSSAVPVTAQITGLAPLTPYYYRLVGVSTSGSNYGADLTFTTSAIPATPPTASTGSATLVTYQGATLTGTANPSGISSNAWFEYGTDNTYGSVTSGTAIGSGTIDVPVAIALGSLNPSTIYHYRLVAASVSGTTPGGDMLFSTDVAPLPPPTAITGSATNIAYQTATLNGSVNPNGVDTNVYFDYGPTPAYGFQTTPLSSGTGTSLEPVSAPVTGLNAGSVCYFRLVAISTSGTSYDSGSMFTTAGGTALMSPIVCSSTGATSLVISAPVNPNGLATGVHFAYGRTTAYGASTPTTVLAASGSAVMVSCTLSALSPHSTYYIVCTATNARGPASSARQTVRTAARFDLNRDGMADLVAFTSRSGVTSVIYTKNGAKLGAAVWGPTIPATFTFCGAADFNGDGKTDWVLFETATRKIWVWYMNGATCTSKVAGPVIPAGYAVAGIADMNGDGKPDLVLYNKVTRQTAVWLMNGLTALTRTPTLGPVLPLGFTIVAVENLYGSGLPNYLLWDSANNQTRILMLNTNLTSASYTVVGPVIPTGYQLAGADGYFSTSDSSDWLLVYPKTGATSIWGMTWTKHLWTASGPVLPAGTSLLQTK